MSAPLHQSSICFVCIVLVQSLIICFEFLPLFCPLQKCGWGDLPGSLCPRQALQFWYCSPEILLPVWADGLTGSITAGLEGLVSVFYSSEKSCSHCAVSKCTILARLVFMSVLSFLVFSFFCLALTVLILILRAIMQYKVHLGKKNKSTTHQRSTTPSPTSHSSHLTLRNTVSLVS